MLESLQVAHALVEGTPEEAWSPLNRCYTAPTLVRILTGPRLPVAPSPIPGASFTQVEGGETSRVFLFLPSPGPDVPGKLLTVRLSQKVDYFFLRFLDFGKLDPRLAFGGLEKSWFLSSSPCLTNGRTIQEIRRRPAKSPIPTK
jgi:hypothetical protein